MIAQGAARLDDNRQDSSANLAYEGAAPQGDKGEFFVWSA